MVYLFRTLAGAISIYSLLCTIRIILTWIPGAAYSPFGRFLASLCDPFLNLFSRIRWLRIGAFDFSPILALAVLTMSSYLVQNLAQGGRVSVAAILALVIQMAWSIIASLLLFLIIILIIRLIVHISGSDRGSILWEQIDSSLNPLVYSVSRLFTAGRPVAYRTALIIAIAVSFLLRFGGTIVIGGLIRMCSLIPV